MQVVQPDKVRFSSPEAEAHEFPIHTVELSDERSRRQFVTLFYRSYEDSIGDWAKATGLYNMRFHSPEIFHRDGKVIDWIKETYPTVKYNNWAQHVHVLLDKTPELPDVTRFASGISLTIIDEIAEYLNG